MPKILRACITVAVSAVASASFAYSARVSIEALVASSDIIVVAKVVDARVAAIDSRTERIATAEVVAVWKGQPSGKRIQYVVSPEWFACDISGARVGESVVLFLSRNSQDGRYHIAHFGRGRMPLIDSDGTLHARMYEVSVPAAVSARGQTRSFPGSIAVDVLHELVKRHAE